MWRSDCVIFDSNGFAEENLNTIFNLVGKRLYTLVAYLKFLFGFWKSHREFLKSTIEVHNVL